MRSLFAIVASISITVAPISIAYSQTPSTTVIPVEKNKEVCFFNNTVYSLGSIFCVKPGTSIHCVKPDSENPTAWWRHVTPDGACQPATPLPLAVR
ncbi:MAG: hypothetical protein AB7O13_21635 [Alphaproteobacteria bacterium]